jgi:hypothetical protein
MKISGSAGIELFLRISILLEIYLIEMLKFKEITREGKIQKLIKT